MKKLILPKWHLDAMSEIASCIHDNEQMNQYRASGAGGGGYSAMPRHLYAEDLARILAQHDPATKGAMEDYDKTDTLRPSNQRLEWKA